MVDGGRALRRLVSDSSRPGQGEMLVKMCCWVSSPVGPHGELWSRECIVETVLLGCQGTEPAFPRDVCKFPQASPDQMLPSAKGNSLGKGVSESLVANTPTAGPGCAAWWRLGCKRLCDW